jgi:hypothetical protein
MSVSARVLDLQARIGEHYEIHRVAFVAVACNNCGTTKSANTDDPAVLERTFDGWVIGTRRPYKDYCPRCT